MFGAANSLFSGLAMAGVIYAIILQIYELGLQREQIGRIPEEQERANEPVIIPRNEVIPMDQHRTYLVPVVNRGAPIRDVELTVLNGPTIDRAVFSKPRYFGSDEEGDFEFCYKENAPPPGATFQIQYVTRSGIRSRKTFRFHSGGGELEEISASPANHCQ